MNTLSESAGAWRPTVQVAAIPDRAPDPAKAAAASGRTDEEFKLFGEDGFTFMDFLDILNPLQHIPVIGTLYRQLSGDRIDPGSRVLGSTLFFGPFGAIASIGDVLIQDATGKDIGEHMMALFENKSPDKETVAEAGTATAQVADAAPTLATATATAAGQEPVDPVTHWARGEIAYRNAIAAKVQASRAAPAATGADAVFHRGQAMTTAPVMPFAPVAGKGANREWAALTTPVDAAGAAPTTATTQTVPYRERNAAAREATSIIRHSRKSAALWAAANYGRPERTPERTDGERKANQGRPAPFGAVAADGGWFTDAMLSAYEKYRTDGGQALNPPAHAVDLMH